jgi:hypothetical protein
MMAPMLGGQVMAAGETTFIKGGSQNVQFAFAADFKTTITVQHSQPGSYNVIANVEWSPNTIFWVCLVIGFFVFGILWIVPVLYFFIDPTNAYQQFFFLIDSKLR